MAPLCQASVHEQAHKDVVVNQPMGTQALVPPAAWPLSSSTLRSIHGCLIVSLMVVDHVVYIIHHGGMGSFHKIFWGHDWMIGDG